MLNNNKSNIMKLIIKTIIIISISILSYLWYQNTKQEYITKHSKIDLLRQDGHLKISWFTTFFSLSGYNLHNQISTMIPNSFSTNSSSEEFVKNAYKDDLSDNGGLLLYVPLYNRETKKKESLVLISAGIDGKLNSEYTNGDTIYDDEYLNRFDFYNLNNYQGIANFSLWKYLFGNKDFLVKYVNCITDNNNFPQTIEYHKYKMHPPKIKQRISLISAFEKDTVIDEHYSIILRSFMDGYYAYCKMHKPQQQKFKKGDTVLISGYLGVPLLKSLFLNHSAIISNDKLPKLSLKEILEQSKLDKRQCMKRNKLLKMK